MLGDEKCQHEYVKQPYTSSPRTPKETYEIYVCSRCKDVHLERIVDLTYLGESRRESLKQREQRLGYQESQDEGCRCGQCDCDPCECEDWILK